MNERKAIEHVRSLTALEKLSVYMNYFVNMLYHKYTDEYYKINEIKINSFARFCDESNIVRHSMGDDFKERGFACKSWVNFTPGSIFHYIFHNTK